MARNIEITTHWTAAQAGGDQMCTDRRTCPGVHTVADRAEDFYVISRFLRVLADGRVLGEVPTAMHPAGQVVTAQVTDPEELAAFADFMGPGEVLGTVRRAEWAGSVPAGA